MDACTLGVQAPASRASARMRLVLAPGRLMERPVSKRLNLTFIGDARCRLHRNAQQGRTDPGKSPAVANYWMMAKSAI